MKLPNEIIFGSRLIKLEFIEKDIAESKKIMGEFHKNTITLDKSLDQVDMIATTIHEVFHFLCDEYSTNLPAKSEELVCNSLANGLCHTLYQNQELLEFLYKSLKK